MQNRNVNAVRFQEILTRNGCKIKTRMGFHEVSDDACIDEGIIVLLPCGEKEDVEALVKDLNTLEGVTAKYLDLN